MRQRYVQIADLTEQSLTERGRTGQGPSESSAESTAEDLAADVAALLADPAIRHARAYRFGRSVPVYRMLAAGGPLTSLLTASPRRPELTDASSTVVAGQQSVHDLSQAIAELRPPGLDFSPRSAPTAGAAAVTVESLMEAGAVKVLPGHRIDPADYAVPAAQHQHQHQSEHQHGVAVLTAEFVREHAGTAARKAASPARMEPWRLASYPRAELTEPGDVAFVADPPTAFVDREGSSVVVTPARILRSREPGVLAEVICRDINTQTTRAWRAWRIRRFAQDPPGLADSLTQLHQLEEQLQRISTELRRLTDLSIDAAASGTVSVQTRAVLSIPDTTSDHSPDHPVDPERRDSRATAQDAG